MRPRETGALFYSKPIAILWAALFACKGGDDCGREKTDGKTATVLR
nr:MAG TPA: hypothetical protein [Bacteriophage sp.]